MAKRPKVMETEKSETEIMREEAMEILKKAQERGLESNFFFRTTFERYMAQLDLMDMLMIEVKEKGAMVVKSYLKGQENVVVNPAMCEYSTLCKSANNTVSTLMSIIQKLSTGAEKESKLQDFLEKFKDDED